MLNLAKWGGTIEINGKVYTPSEIPSDFKFCSDMVITLHTTTQNTVEIEEAVAKVYRVTVKQYMTKPSSPEFDFMARWNSDIPMPLRTMVGTVTKETKGMYFMELHGDITQERTQCCMRCGKPITNPVSQYFGMGPECGSHGYVNPFDTDEELREAVSNYKKELQNITWSGWVIKSAITEMEEI